MSQCPRLTWAFAWGLTGAALVISNVWSGPRHGPIWLGMVLGALAWGVAGAATFWSNQILLGLVVWVAAYAVAFLGGGFLGGWFENHQFGPYVSAGFVGMLIGWFLGSGIGGLLAATLGLAAEKRPRTTAQSGDSKS